MKEYKNIIFDADDTLWKCHIYYAMYKEEFGVYQSHRTGLPESLCIEILDAIDLASCKQVNGFTTKRFPTSFEAASHALDVISHRDYIDIEAATTSREIGKLVFDAPYEFFTGVKEMLEKYVKYKNVFLLTKGDVWLQDRKIRKNGLDKLIDPSHIYIVGKKTRTEIEKIIVDHELQYNETIMVGDSLKDDIQSAVDTGIDSVYVKNDRGTWGYDVSNATPTFMLAKTVYLPTVIPFS